MLNGKTALVTGSTAGQGARVAAALAAQGANIILSGMGEQSAIDAQQRMLENSYGIKTAYHPADLSSVSQITDMVGFSKSAFGTVDILINNAVIRKGHPVAQYRTEDWDLELAVNLSAAFHLIRLTIEGMRAKDWGRIINLSSNLGIFGTANRAGYVTTKTALLGLTRGIAMEVAFTGVTCNAICPSAMIGLNSEAQLQKLQDGGMTPEEAKTAFLKDRRSTRFVDTLPEVITFLCSEGARDMNGISLPVDLGSTAGRPTA